MANTTIQILRSYVNTEPTSLDDGELAYSFVSNIMFIGDSSNEILKVGGEFYTNTIDLATSNNTPNTLVIRDSNGAVNVVVETVDGGTF
jgi:hypothetical protein